MRSRIFTIIVIAFLITGCNSSPENEFQSSLESYHGALQLIQEARESMGGTSHLKSSGGLYLRGEGTYDLSTRMQGMRPNVEEPYPMKEQLAVDLESGRVAYESDTHVNPDAREWIRYTYDGQNRMLFLELYAGFAFWDSRPGLNRQSKRYTNMVPHLLIEEAYANRESLKYLGKDSEGRDLVSFETPSYGSLTLYFDSATHELAGVEYLKDMPLLGDTSIRWRFKDYNPVEGIGLYPSGYTVSLNDKMLKDISYTTIRPGSENAEVRTIPDSINVPDIPDPPAEGEPEGPVSESPIREPVKLAGGVHVFPHIRSGFHPMVIEFDEFLMVVDTPAGWLEMHQLPAMQWVDGVTSSSTGRKLLRGIREKLSDKPVRYVALTHYHSDHAGGIRPFIAEETIVLASSVTTPVIERAAKKRFTLEPDEVTNTDISPTIEIVDGERIISDGNMEVRLIDVGENPHAEGMLVVYLPEQKIRYQSDLFEPVSMHAFPSKSRLPVMKWFVEWLDNSGLDVDKVYAIHAGLRVTEEHLEVIRRLKED